MVLFKIENETKSNFVRNITNKQERVYEVDPNYFVGIAFMLIVIGVLLYVNLFYDFSLKKKFINIYKSPMCKCLKLCIIIHKNDVNMPKENNFVNERKQAFNFLFDSNDENYELKSSLSSVFLKEQHDDLKNDSMI